MQSSTMTVEIEHLEVWCSIGVTAEERSWPQKLLISVKIPIPTPHADEIDATTDYAAVCETIRQISTQSSRKLLETLAIDISNKITLIHKTKPLKIKIRKFVIPSSSAVVLDYNP